MALPSIVTTTDTFQVWFDATNNLISHVANSNYYLIAGQTLTGTATVNGAVTVKSLTVSNSAVFGTTSTDTAVFNSTVTMTQPLTLTSQLSTTNVVATGSGDFGTTLRVAANAEFDTNVLFVDATNNRVGLGNTTPAHVLRVEGTTSLNGAVNALSTLSVSGAVNALGALGVTGALTALSTLSVSGAVNALGAFGVSGAANALSTFGVSGAANALGTLGVSGTLTALGQMAVTANANFDSGTLFVDAVNNRVGVGTTSPTTAVDVNGTVTATTFSGSFSGSGASITSLNATNISSGSLNLARLGTVSGGRIIMGNTSNQAEALSITGDVTISSGGVTSIASNVIVNADINTGAAIAYSKLSLSNSIVNADINTGAAIAYSKLSLSNSIVNADINTGAAIAISKLAASTISGVSLGSNLNNVTFNNGGAGAVSGSTYNGSSAITVSYNTVGAPSTSGTNASGTWGINISGTAYGKSEGNLNANSATYASEIAAGTRLNVNRYNPFAGSGGSILFREYFSNADKWVMESYNSSGTQVFRIFSTGGSANTLTYIPEIGGTAWIFVSDERTKDLFGPIEAPKEKLSQLRTVYGKFKGDDTNRQQAFLIAQDVQKVLPEAVHVSSDKGFEDLLSLNHNQVLVLAIAAIKELIADNEGLKTRLAALEASV